MTTTAPDLRLHPWRDLTVMTGRSLRHAVRGVDALLIGLMLPVSVMVLMTTVFGGALDTGHGSYVDYVVPGVILLCAGYGASLTAVAVHTDLRTGALARFRTMNLLPAAAVLGHVVAGVLRNLVSVGLVIGTALWLGFRPRADLGGWLLVLAVVTLFVLALTLLSAAVGLAAPSTESAGAFGFVLLFLPYLSSAFVPVDTLPGWLRPFAAHQPFTPLTDTLRAVLAGEPAGSAAGVGIVWCLGVGVVGAAVTVALWRRRRR